MQKKVGTLGRGLGALLSDSTLTPPPPALAPHTDPNPEKAGAYSAEIDRHYTPLKKEVEDTRARVENLDLDSVKPMHNQPRQLFDDATLEELATSIKSYGILQPLIVTKDMTGNFTLIAGERRWRAARLAGLTQVPCIVRKPDEHSELELALIENIQREELNSVDEARALQRLITDHQYTHETLAAKIGKERTTITNTLRLLTLHPEILEDISQKRLTSGHARALCALEDRKIQLRARDTVIAKKLSVRQTEELVKNIKRGGTDARSSSTEEISPDLRYICDQFKGHLGTKVKIAGSSSKGKIEINYYTLEDLERLTELILGNPLATRPQV